MTDACLLPSNATDLEVAAAGAAGARLDAIPVPLRPLVRPHEVQADLLPWLAWGRSVGFWSPDWSEAQKRHAVARAWTLHGLHGTVAGFREIAALGGGALIRAVVPPAKTFLAPSWTAEDLEAYHSRFPELRLYHDRTRGERVGALPAGPTADPHAKTYLGRAHPAVTTARWRMAGQAVLVAPNGAETPLTTFAWSTDQETISAVSDARPADAALVSGGDRAYELRVTRRRGWTAVLPDMRPGATSAGLHPGARAFAADAKAVDRWHFIRTTKTLRVDHRTLAARTVQPSRTVRLGVRDSTVFAGGEGGGTLQAEPLNVLARPVAQRSTQGSAMLGRVWLNRRFSHVADTGARGRLFERTRLFDRSVVPEARGRTFHVGAMRLGMPPYHADLKIAFRARRRRLAAGRYVYGHLVRSDFAATHSRVFRALRWAAPARDRILIDTVTHRPVRAGGGRLAGTCAAGAFVET